MASATVWLLNFQSYNGHFQEYDNTSLHHAYIVENPFDETSYISLTAHVLIALERVMENLQGNAFNFCAEPQLLGSFSNQTCLKVYCC